mgnify:FL=1
MKIVFFGTPEYVLPILTSLHKKFVTGPGKSPIEAVVTQSPKPVGRAQLKEYSAIDKWGFEHKIPVYYSSMELLKEGTDADLGILAAFSEIIPPEVIKLFPNGILNIHPSLLPKLRGASPIQGTILTEDSTSGVTIMKMDEKLDHGQIISQFKDEIKPDDTTGSLRTRLFERSAEVLVEMLEPYLDGKIKLKTQDESDVTTTRKITKEDGRIPGLILADTLQGSPFKGAWKIDFVKDFETVPTPILLDKFIRAMYPWPEAWTMVKVVPTAEPKRLKILKSHLGETTGILEIDEVQMEGKTPVSWKQFTAAYPEAKFS